MRCAICRGFSMLTVALLMRLVGWRAGTSGPRLEVALAAAGWQPVAAVRGLCAKVLCR
jgi:hypothetical protein